MCGNIRLLYKCLMLTLIHRAHWVTDQYLPMDHTLSSIALADQAPGILRQRSICRETARKLILVLTSE